MTTIEDIRHRHVPLLAQSDPTRSLWPCIDMILDYLAERDGQPTQGECRGCADYRRVLEGEKIATRDATRECNELLGENQRLRAQLAACERERDELRAKAKPDEGWRGKCVVVECDDEHYPWNVYSPSTSHWLSSLDGGKWHLGRGVANPNNRDQSGIFRTKSAALAALAKAPSPPDAEQPASGADDEAAAMRFLRGGCYSLQDAFKAGAAHARGKA